MAPNRHVRGSHAGEIPDNLTLSWQSSAATAPHTKPRLVRRPKTACEACRTAKIKCNGQNDCNQCIARGIICKYAAKGSSHKSPGSEESRRLERGPECQITNDSMSGEFANDFIMGGGDPFPLSLDMSEPWTPPEPSASTKYPDSLTKDLDLGSIVPHLNVSEDGLVLECRELTVSMSRHLGL